MLMASFIWLQRSSVPSPMDRHDAGVFHGDLKPSNVLLTPSGKSLLIDFNLAKDRRSNAGPRGGTLAYMPPEQLAEVTGSIDEHASNYDARFEIYSFGALLYQLLTGQVPFRGDVGATEPIMAATNLIACQRTQRPQSAKVESVRQR